MSWAKIVKAINSQIHTPLNYLSWIQNIETYGSKGYAGRSADIKNKLCGCEEAVSDGATNVLLFQWVLDTGFCIGTFFEHVYDMETLDWENYNTFEEVLEENETLQAIMDNYISAEMLILTAKWRNILTDNTKYLEALVKSEPAVERLFETPYVTYNLLYTDAIRRKIILESPYAVEIVANDTELIKVYTSRYSQIMENEIEWTLAMNQESIVKLFMGSSAYASYIASHNGGCRILLNSDVALPIAAYDTYFMGGAGIAGKGRAMRQFFLEDGIYERAKKVPNRIDYIENQGHGTFVEYIPTDKELQVSETKKITISINATTSPQVHKLEVEDGKLYLIDKVLVYANTLRYSIDYQMLLVGDGNGSAGVSHDNSWSSKEVEIKRISRGFTITTTLTKPADNKDLVIQAEVSYREVTLNNGGGSQ